MCVICSKGISGTGGAAGVAAGVSAGVSSSGCPVVMKKTLFFYIIMKNLQFRVPCIHVCNTLTFCFH